jgi:YkoP-like protein
MGRHRPTLPVAQANPPPCPLPQAGKGRVGADHPWLGALVEVIDRPLRRRYGVSEYTQSSRCFLRMQTIRSTRELLLKDGICVQPGDRIINLHFWNEQVPQIPAAGPILGWARQMSVSFELSLQELARHLATRTDMNDVVAIRLEAALGAVARSGQIGRILSRFGFQVMPRQDSLSVVERIHRYSENILITLMVLVRNAAALRSDTLIRDRVVAYLSRRALEQRYGASATDGLRTWQ